MKLMNSIFGKLNFKDLVKSFALIVITCLTATVGQIVNGWIAQPVTFPHVDMPNLILSVKVALVAGVSYLFKNKFSNSDGAFLKKEVPKY